MKRLAFWAGSTNLINDTIATIISSGDAFFPHLPLVRPIPFKCHDKFRSSASDFSQSYVIFIIHFKCKRAFNTLCLHIHHSFNFIFRFFDNSSRSSEICSLNLHHKLTLFLWKILCTTICVVFTMGSRVTRTKCKWEKEKPQEYWKALKIRGCGLSWPGIFLLSSETQGLPPQQQDFQLSSCLSLGNVSGPGGPYLKAVSKPASLIYL